MRKVAFVLLFICSITKNSSAQYVTIPDSLFAHILDSVLTSCMNGNQLDTTCPDLLNITYFQHIITGIKDLTGIQYFKNVNTLHCSRDTSLVLIPALPPHLRYFSFDNTHLTSLPRLPASLYALSCLHSWLDTLPLLPDSLEVLDCSYNRVHKLPELPPHLNGLTCGINLLDSLPDLPSLLIGLTCDFNRLTRLPDLPASLQQLACDGNRLTDLPALPVGLVDLYCSNNQLSSLPALPGSVLRLYCDHNLLTGLPDLPAFLNDLSCGYNYHLSCLPEIGYIGEFRWDSTDIRCLPDTSHIYGSSVPTLSSVPLCRYYNPNACSATGIKETSCTINLLHCYPSPTSSSITIDMSGYDAGDRQLHIYDQLGQIVYQVTTTQAHLLVDTVLVSGIYTVEVAHASRREYARFVRE